MEKVRAQVRVKKNIYVHNDIQQAAFYFSQKVSGRAAADDREGIGYDMMACLLFLAFAVEANFNFVGHKLLDDWDERKPAIEKVKIVLMKLGIDDSLEGRPYKTIGDLKKFRDALAHGKPEQVNIEGEVIATVEELRQQGNLSPRYEAFLDENIVKKMQEDMEAIWKNVLERSGLDIIDTISQGGVEFTILEEADED